MPFCKFGSFAQKSATWHSSSSRLENLEPGIRENFSTKNSNINLSEKARTRSRTARNRGGSGLVFLPYLLFLPVPAYRYRCTIYYPAVNFRSVRRRHDREEPDPDNHSSVHRENSTHQDFSDKPRTHVGEHAPWARRPIINCAAELIRRKRPPSRRVAVFILFVCTALYHYLRVGHC